MRKLGIAVLIIAVLVVAAALILPHVIDVNSYHDQIQAQLEKKLGRQVTLGQMSLSLFPPSFQVANASVGEDKNFHSTRPFAQAEKLAISVKFWPLLHKQVEISSLQLEKPQIELVRNSQGQWNFASLGQESKPAPTPRAPAPSTSASQPAEKPGQPQPASQPEANKQSSGEQIELANLQINDGQIAITDQQKHQSRAIYDHIDLNVSNFSPNQEFSIKAAAHLPGQGKQALWLEGKGGPIKQADLLNTNFDGKLRLDQVSVAAAQKFLNSQALSGIDAMISGDAKVKNSGGKLASDGSIKLENAHIRNVNVGYPITLDYDVNDDLNTDVIQIHRGNLKLGSTPLTIAGTLNTRPTPSQIDLKLTAADASIAEAARLASAFGVAFGQGMDVTGKVNANIQARGEATKPSMNGQLTAREVSISGKELPQPVKVNGVQLALTPDMIRSNEFTASTGATSLTVNFALAQYTSDHSTVNASLRAANARLGEVLNIAKAYGVSAVDGMSGDGLLSIDVNVQGPTKNPSALNFNGSGKLQNASLKMPSLTKPIQVHNSDLRFSQNSATLQSVSATVGQTNANGTLTLKNFAAPQVQFTLNADKINVAELQQIFGAAQAAPRRAEVRKDFWQLVPPAEAEPAAGNEPSIVNKMTGGGTINVGTILYDDLTLANTHANVALNHGIVQISPLTSELYGGKANGAVTIDMRPAQPVYTVNLKTDKVDANKLLSSVSSIKQMLYGMLTSNVNASFSSTNAEAIARGLNGNLALNLTNGKLMNLDMLNELASVGRFVGGRPSAPKNFTDLVQLSGNFDVKNGVANTQNLKAVIDGGTLAANGLVNLADQSLNMHVTAVLNKVLSQQVGGTQVGGLMNTALANNAGELVIPIILTGNFQHPQVAPDVQAIAQMKLQNLLPTSKNPGALTSGIVGAILGGKNQQGNNGQQGGIGGILGTLSGKQQQQNQQQQPPNNNQGVSNNSDQQQQPPQNKSPLGGILDQVLQNKKKKQEQQQQQQTPPATPPAQTQQPPPK